MFELEKTYIKKEVDIENEISPYLLTGMKSEKTLKDYFFYLKDFLKMFYHFDEKVIKSKELIEMLKLLEKQELASYISHLKTKRKLKNSSINKIISAIKYFYGEIELRDDNFINPTRGIKFFKTDIYDPKNILRLSKEDISIMIESIEIKNEKTYRNKLLLKTLYYTGMRSDEIRSLKFSNITKEGEAYIIQLEKTKSQKIQYVPLFFDLAKEIEKYKDYLIKVFLIDNIENFYVFPSVISSNKKLSSDALNLIIKKISKKTIDKNISAHNFRHSIATEMLMQDDISLLEVQDFLRHASINTTKIYDDAVELRKQNLLSKMPRLKG